VILVDSERLIDQVLPKYGMTMTDACVVQWLVSVGEAVSEGQDIVEVETDKTTMLIPSTATGTVEEILLEQDGVAPVGAVIARIRARG
jgi:pyruvate/2-oxoglutarate dehydrogenase complex dihydrolipoamide acyltransferase (E2) component